MRVFVTGATGYIGHAVCLRAKKHGHDVIGLARSESAKEKLLRADIHPVMGDLNDAAVLAEMAHDADAVVHTAFAMEPGGVELERKALEAMLGALDTDHEAFVYTSGLWVYGSRGDAIIAEDAPLAPLDVVAWRPAHETLVLESAKHHLRPIVIRPGIVYGDGGGIPGDMIERAKAGELRIVGDGNNRWSCVRVDALAELYVLALEEAAAGSVYNAVTGAAPTYAEIARAASRAAGGDGRVDSISLEEARTAMGPLAGAFTCDLQATSEKARRELGWDPHRPTILEELSNTTVV
jgi:nucleoside-diphosphate-sugar epimerase